MFTMRLPLTLAVTRALMVKANGQSFAVPLDVVTQIMRLEMSKIERIGKEPVVRLDGKVYPLLMLSRLLNLRQHSTSGADEMELRPPALLLKVEGKEVVLIVDQLQGGREIVIKTLGNHLRKVHGVMGATLMGDGEVVLILNLAELLRGTVRVLARRAPTSQLSPSVSESAASDAPLVATEQPLAPPKAKAEKQTLTVMIVDDSPSVRRVSSNLIKNVGWIPVQAKDGLDALEQLQAGETRPDLMMLDIEMPRMDGYQLLSSLRSLAAFRHLPVVIVSSRSSEKHRQKAFDLGATEYLVKPYQEEQVVTLIRRLVQEAQQ
jgi:chemosensory pili system protein ChpA (sensor histidine kinase/response regulator)